MTKETRYTQEEIEQPNFISIGGLSVTIEEFLAIWNGEEVLPTLDNNERDEVYNVLFPVSSRQEYVEFLGIPYEVIKAGWTLRSIKHQLNGNATDTTAVGRAICGKKLEKLRQLQAMIERFQTETGKRESLNMDRILAAVSGGDMRFSTIAEFLAKMPNVEPTINDAESISSAAKEVGGAELMTASYVDTESVEPVGKEIEDVRYQLLATFLGVKAEKLMGLPKFIVERALSGNGANPSIDDYRELTRRHNIGSNRVVDVISATRAPMLLGGFGMMATGIYEGVNGNLDVALQLMESGIYTVGFAATLLTTYPAALRAPVVREASSNKKYARKFEKFARQVEKLEGTLVGQFQLAFLRAAFGILEVGEEDLRNLQGMAELLQNDAEVAAEFERVHKGREINFLDVREVLELGESVIDFYNAFDGEDALVARMREVSDGEIGVDFVELPDPVLDGVEEEAEQEAGAEVKA